MKLKIRVAETKDFSPTVKKRLQEFGELEFRDFQEEESLNSIFENNDIFWFRLGRKITKELIEMPSRRVKFIATPVTGLNHIDVESCQRHGVQIISLKGEQAFLKEVRATAEHTILLTLALMRKIIAATQDTMSGNWDREPFKGTEIYKKKVGIIGYGRLGKIVADYFKALGAKILVYEKYPLNFVKHDVTFTSLEDLLAQSDIVSLHINYLPENIRFLKLHHFALMKSSAIFINTSRGQLIDGNALVIALRKRMIAGAAIDVISDEFNTDFAPELVFFKTACPDNFIITPHIGGNTWESFEKTEAFIFDKLKQFVH